MDAAINNTRMNPPVHIAFDCIPLRSVGRLDIPLDASAAHRAHCQRLQDAIHEHGTENAYYLHQAMAVFRLANSAVDGMLRFEFQGTVLTDASDRKAVSAELDIRLAGNTALDMDAAALAWWQQIVRRAVVIEFDRFVAAGKLPPPADQPDSWPGGEFTGMHL